MKIPLQIIRTFLEWFVFGVLIGLYAIVLSPNLPTKKYISTYIVSTGSMKPKVEPGSIALIRQTDTKQIKKDDIIIFTSPNDPNQTVLHRVFAVKQKNNRIEFNTKGDNNNAPDNWTVPESSIKGIYLGMIPLLGHPAAFLKTPKGFLLLFGIPAVLLVLLQIKKIREGIEEEVQKRVKATEEKKKKADILNAIIFLILTGISGIVGIQTVQALFISKVTASSISFSVKDFVPPNKPANLHWNTPDVACGGTTKNLTITADWDDTTDIGGSGIDHYEYTITYPKIGGGTGNWTTTVKPSQYNGAFNQDNGVHIYKIRAWDKAGNVSEWSDACTITYDTKPAPLPTIYQWGGGKEINSSTLVQCWSIVNDLYSNPVTYEYESYNDPEHASLRWKGTFNASHIGTCGTFGPAIIKNATGDPAGPVYYQIRTKDALGNTSAWISDYFIIDNTSPTASLSVEGSWIKKVEETVKNGGFENGSADWMIAGNVTTIASDTIDESPVFPNSGSLMARIGQTEGNAGSYSWENRLMQSFTTGAKSLSLRYNFFTRDSFYDTPGFFIKINGYDIFHQSAWMTNPLDGSGVAYSTGWQEWSYDLSTITDPFTNLSISAGNTDTPENQSWVYIDDVTTYIVTAPSDATYTISGDDPHATYVYTVDAGLPTPYGRPFTIEADGQHTLQYYAQDPAGNKSGVYRVNITTDATSPSAPNDFAAYSASENNMTLNWTATGDDFLSGRASSYDLRYSTSPITDSTFDAASKSGTLASPSLSGYEEQALIEGLNPGTEYFFALKVLDEAPNASDMVTTSGTTLPSSIDNPGDVVINEIMWTGTSKSSEDIWMELRNMTDRTISLSGWKLQEYADFVTDTDLYTFPSDATLAPHGFLVISKTSASDSSLKNTGIVAPSLVFNQTNFRLTLTDALANTIDTAWNGNALPSEYSETGVYFYSMERTAIPGDGTVEIRWYPCIDEASKTEFFDGSGIDFGTPGAINRSENEPLVYAFLQHTSDSENLNEPILTLTHDEKTHEISFSVTNIQSYTFLSWELSYDSNDQLQGAVGNTELTEEKDYTKGHIFLGTCSTGGSCVSHIEVKNLHLKVILKKADGKELILEKTL